MATIAKKRLNISLSADTDKYLAKLAKRDGIPAATKATLLLEYAMALEEDFSLAIVAKERDTPKARYMSHSDAWS